MNAEYTNAAGTPISFTVEPGAGSEPPHATKISERSTCGKWIYEHVLVYDYYDEKRDVAIYTLMGTGKRLA